MLPLPTLLITVSLIQFGWGCMCSYRSWAEKLDSHDFALNVTIQSQPVEFELDNGMFNRYTITVIEAFKLPDEKKADEVGEIYFRSGMSSCAIETKRPGTNAIVFGKLGSSKESKNESFMLVEYCGIHKIIPPAVPSMYDEIERENAMSNEINPEVDIKIIVPRPPNSKPYPDYEWELLKPTSLHDRPDQEPLGQFEPSKEFADAQRLTLDKGVRSQPLSRRPEVADDEDYPNEAVEGSGHSNHVNDVESPVVLTPETPRRNDKLDENLAMPKFEKSAMSNVPNADANNSDYVPLNCSLLFMMAMTMLVFN